MTLNQFENETFWFLPKLIIRPIVGENRIQVVVEVVVKLYVTWKVVTDDG